MSTGDSSRLGGRMHRLFVLKTSTGGCFIGRALVYFGLLLLCCGTRALAQSAASPAKVTSPFGIRATHLLGLPNTKSNCKGTLSAEGNVLRFKQNGKPAEQVDIASVRDIFLGEETMQVGGLPMNIGKAAAPYGGGRVVSLFAHAKYDILTLEYVDTNGGVHGAIFQLRKGEGELMRDEIL